METLENKITLHFHRADIERVIGETMTDDQWVALAWNLESQVENAGNNIAYELWQDIDSLVEEDKELDE